VLSSSGDQPDLDGVRARPDRRGVTPPVSRDDALAA